MIKAKGGRPFFLGFLTLFLAACGGVQGGGPQTRREALSPPSEPPAWYTTLRSDRHTLRGVGEGASPEEATARARAAILNEMEVQITSEFQVLTVQQGESVARRVQEDIRSVSARKMGRSEKIHNEVWQNRYLVGVEVDIRPDKEILASRILETWRKEGKPLPARVTLQGPKALVEGPLARYLEGRLASPGGEGERSGHLDLSRSQVGWVLIVFGEVLNIAETTELFDFSACQKSGLRLSLESPDGKPLSTRLKTGTPFVFRARGSGEGGYVSLINLYPDGRVSLAAENMKVEGKSPRIPEAPLYLETATLKPGVASLDLYLFLFSKDPLELTRFRHLVEGGGFVEGEDSYKAHELAGLLDRLTEKGVSIGLITVETL